MTNPEAERLDRLITMAQELSDEVEELSRDSGRQFVSLAHTAKQNRLMIWALILGGVLEAILSVVLAFSLVSIRSNTDRIDTLTQRLDIQQTDNRRRALCPVYQLFLDTETKEGRAAAPDKEKYDHSFEVIRKGYGVLECASFEGNY